MKIIRRGLILVASPLVLALFFFVVLFDGLSELDWFLRHDLTVKDALINFNNFVRCTNIAGRCEVLYRYNHEPRFKKFSELNRRQAAAANERVKAISHDNPTLPIPVINLSSSKTEPKSSFDKDLEESRLILVGADQLDASEAIVPLRHISNRSVEDVYDAENSLRATVVISMLLAPLLSVLLAAFFYVMFSNRFKAIIADSAHGTISKAPLQGDDELAEIDRFLTRSVKEIGELENLNRVTIEKITQELNGGIASIGGLLRSSDGNGTLSASIRKEEIDRIRMSLKRFSEMVVPSPSSPLQTEKSNKSVLKQGLVLICLALALQIASFFVIGRMLDQISQQVRLEHVSKRVLVSLNEVAENVITSSKFAAIYMYSQNNDCMKAWNEAKSKAISLLGVVADISGETQQKRDIEACRINLEQWSLLVSSEAARLTEYKELDGFGKMLASGLSAQTLKQLPHSLHAAVVEMRKRLADPQQTKLFEMLIDRQSTFEQLMAGEQTKLISLGEQRSKSIEQLKNTIIAGIVLNIALLVFLVVLVINNLSGRLHHVMANVVKTEKREALDSPVNNFEDEIAYLDRVVFETGTRLIQLESFRKELVCVVNDEIRAPLLSVCSAFKDIGEAHEVLEEEKIRLKAAEEAAAKLVHRIDNLLGLESECLPTDSDVVSIV